MNKVLWKVFRQAFVVMMTVAVSSGAAYAQAAPPAAAGAGAEEQDVEVLLNTLNEVLEENRKIRQELLDNEDSLKKLAKENNVLRSQVGKFRRESERTGDADKQKVLEMEESLKELEQKVQGLREENEKLQELKEHHERRIPELEEEAGQLHHLLDRAVLEGERGQYLELIESAQLMADRSLGELARSKSRMIELRDEMADAHYMLGNMLYDMKDFENAVISYRRALEADPANAWVHHNLGIIHDYYIHDDQRALYHYAEYLRLKPVEEQAHQIRERILELELKKNMKPQTPLRKDYFENYNKVPR